VKRSSAVEHECSHGAEYGGDACGDETDAQCHPGSVDETLIEEDGLVPFGGETCPNGDQSGFIEGVDHQQDDR